ncbi:hypothetical protein NQD34_015284 [Periophthalmus magnuspinnatus]|nr:hypothetical protein NQD34_015284 [Periophthalmus magnuspinnatus]
MSIRSLLWARSVRAASASHEVEANTAVPTTTTRGSTDVNGLGFEKWGRKVWRELIQFDFICDTSLIYGPWFSPGLVPVWSWFSPGLVLVSLCFSPSLVQF